MWRASRQRKWNTPPRSRPRKTACSYLVMSPLNRHHADFMAGCSTRWMTGRIRASRGLITAAAVGDACVACAAGNHR
jgi:hypothetical protein